MSKPPADDGTPTPDPQAAPQDGSRRDGDRRQGEMDLWREVFAESERGLRRFLAGRLPQSADVEDCLQAVSVAMLKNETPIPAQARRAWLYRVAANEAAKWWRKKSTTDRVMERHADTMYQVHSAKTESASLPEIETLETVQQIRRAIDKLPEETQRIIRMRLSDGLTFQQIADQTGLPLGTVLTRMRRAMQRIRSEFDPDQ